MRLGNIALIAATMGALSACAASTGVLPAGPNTYTISEHFAAFRGGTAEVEEIAITKADDYCTSQGLEFVPVKRRDGPTDPHANGWAPGYAMTFKCLPSNDPAVVAYQLQQAAPKQAAPKLIIGQQNR